ncbi:hypothetical protein HAZT_HAZT010021 [Hyalella azteca]|uniref:Uncharacterized protein n=1 Tax=Hyalella azteca TaxID=294128 RepID=A0A6A0GUK4_HYAAZ|nr:hypothetical protein HAZT_HAZT010021 [Hyalella azteca]
MISISEVIPSKNPIKWYIPTIENTYRQVITCNKNICTLQITDTTGSHQFPAMQRLSIGKGHAFILVYSVTSRQSLEELRPIRDVIVEMKVRFSEPFRNC